MDGLCAGLFLIAGTGVLVVLRLNGMVGFEATHLARKATHEPAVEEMHLTGRSSRHEPVRSGVWARR